MKIHPLAHVLVVCALLENMSMLWCLNPIYFFCSPILCLVARASLKFSFFCHSQWNPDHQYRSYITKMLATAFEFDHMMNSDMMRYENCDLRIWEITFLLERGPRAMVNFRGRHFVRFHNHAALFVERSFVACVLTSPLCPRGGLSIHFVSLTFFSSKWNDHVRLSVWMTYLL